ncbi:MAG: SDR family NAD(P)-dependent oxidoreductase [Chloroflexi bacterium]|nr:SDR family NAD(P)-dependent oxidoreductase [Chloroflexota bacterium]
MSDFTDQVVLIIGAGRGLGSALAKAFAAQGALVAANDLTPINVDEVVAEIIAAGGKAKVYLADAAKKIALQTMVTEVLEDWGRIDVLVNHANVKPQDPLLDIDEWDWRRAVDVNLNAVFLAIQSVGRVMRDLGGGVIINIGPEPAKTPEKTASAAYLSSKAGVVALTRGAASELAEYNIRVSAVQVAGNYTDSALRQILELCSADNQEFSGELITIPA